jgi:glutathione peroxidase
MKSIHDFKIQNIEGETLDFSAFKGKKIMVVNVASACGFTPQYQQLQELYEKFSDKLVIVGMPCNDFGGQEPDDEAAIQQFCSMRFGVTFPLTVKVGILQDTHPIYQFLTNKAENGVKDSTVKWNFYKYLLDTEGGLVRVLPSTVSPFDDVILDWVNA